MWWHPSSRCLQVDIQYMHMECTQPLPLFFFLNKVTIHLYIIRFFMKDWIISYMYYSLIITKQFRMKRDLSAKIFKEHTLPTLIHLQSMSLNTLPQHLTLQTYFVLTFLRDQISSNKDAISNFPYHLDHQFNLQYYIQ